MNKYRNERRISRRQMLKLVGAGTATAILTACAPAATPAPEVEATEPPAAEPTEPPEPEDTPAPAPEPFELVVAAHWPLDTSSGWDGIVAEYLKRHPEAEIVTQDIPYGEYDVKLLTQVAAGTVPDAMAVGALYNWSLVKKGVLAVLDDYMAVQGVSADEYSSAYVAERTFDGELYSLPYDMQPDSGLFYDKAAFAEAGVEVPGQDYTWDDLRGLAQALTKMDADGNVERHGLMSVPAIFALLSYANGWVDDAATPTKCTLDSDSSLEAVQILLDMMYVDKSMLTPQAEQDMGAWNWELFGAGKAAMMFVGWWPIVVAPDPVKDLDLGYMVAPTGPGGHRAYQIHNTSFGVAKDSEYGELAAEFVLLMLSPTGWEFAWKAAKGNVFPMAHLAAFEKYLEYPEGPLVEDRWVNRFGAEYGVFFPRHGRWTEISGKFINPDMDLVMRGEKPAAEALAAMAEQVTKELAIP